MSFTRATDRLCIAALPDPVAAQDIGELAWHLRDVHRLTGRPLLPQHIHSMLWHVYDGLFPPPAGLVDELVQRLSGIDMSCFRVSFDHAASVDGGAFVLCGREGVAGLGALNRQIGASFAAGGMAGAPSIYTPHVTLLRDPRPVPVHELASPIEWEVTELVLVHSLRGRAIQHPVARLPLKRRNGN